MDKLEQYRQIIQALLSEYVKTPIAKGEIESQLVVDIERDYIKSSIWDEMVIVGCMDVF